MEHHPKTYQELRQVLSNLDQSYWESQADKEEEHAQAQRQNIHADVSNCTNNHSPANEADLQLTSLHPSLPYPSGLRPPGNNTTAAVNPISAKEREHRCHEGLCICCAATWGPGHTCTNQLTTAHAVTVLGVADDDMRTDNDNEGSNTNNADNAPEENLGAIQDLPGEV